MSWPRLSIPVRRLASGSLCVAAILAGSCDLEQANPPSRPSAPVLRQSRPVVERNRQTPVMNRTSTPDQVQVHEADDDEPPIARPQTKTAVETYQLVVTFAAVAGIRIADERILDFARQLAAALAGPIATVGHDAQAPGTAGSQDPIPEAIHDHMELMDHDFRKLRRQARDPEQNESSIELISAMQDHALAAKRLTPSKAESLSGDELAAFLTAYRLRMIELLRLQLEAEAALLEARNEQAYDVLKKIQRLKAKSHEEFQIK